MIIKDCGMFSPKRNIYTPPLKSQGQFQESDEKNLRTRGDGQLRQKKKETTK